MSQSRHHDMSESVKSHKSPTAELFDVDSEKISIVTVNTKEYDSDVLARSQGYCGFMKKSISANEREVTAGDSAGNALGANHRLSAVSLDETLKKNLEQYSTLPPLDKLQKLNPFKEDIS
ncbi:hypothetical protein Tco_1113799 [Tanacetum coccineum]|uniref:Uncharacterized protein n=1 Tax=Tanacetum coccineum TaxID=301880 RepID=A0ABQ5IT74_9ASTR